MEEIACLVGVHRDTLHEHMKEDPELNAAIQKGRDMGRVTLRRFQWKRAEDGSDTMLIWLGKQLLGQRDNVTLAHAGADGTGPVQSVTATVPITDPIEAARAYQRIMAED
jgi:hypothetical protein